MDAKSLLFRMLLKRVLKRTAMAAVLAWLGFAWATGRIEPMAGLARVWTVVSEKLHHKSQPTIALMETPEAAASRASALARASGVDPAGGAAAAGAHAKGGYGSNDLLCLAHAIYYEARGEPRDTQIGVAQVALNRVAAMPGQKSICRIVYLGLGRPMGCLFAQTCRNLGTIPDDETRWRAAIELARDVAAGRGTLPIYAQATHFNGSSLRPSWVSGVYKLHRAGRFTFYASQPVEADAAAVSADAGRRPEAIARPAVAPGSDEAAGLAARRKAANLPRAAAAEKTGVAARAEPAAGVRGSRSELSRSPFGDTFN